MLDWLGTKLIQILITILLIVFSPWIAYEMYKYEKLKKSGLI